ncbi:hypothetical protein BsWGS_22673 [Bradybaena similaris]
MRSSTAPRLTAPRLEDHLWTSSIRVSHRGAVLEAPAPGTHVTTVQISPIRAPPEVTSAIRRQKQAGLYSRDPEHAKPEFKVVLRGNFHPDSTRFIVTQSHCLSGGPASWSSKNDHQRCNDVAAVNHWSGRRTRSFDSGSGSFKTFKSGAPSPGYSVSWSRRNGRHSDTYNQPTAESGFGNPARQSVWSWYENERYHTPLSVVGKSARTGDASRTSLQDQTLPKIWSTHNSSGSGIADTVWKQGLFDREAVRASTSAHTSTTDNHFHIPSMESYLQAKSNHVQTLTRSAAHRTLPKNAGEPPSLQPYRGMPGLQFADAVLDSMSSSLDSVGSSLDSVDSSINHVDSNLDHLRKLCQTKFRYYDYFDHIYPGVLLESSKPTGQEHNSSHCFVASNSATHFNRPLSPPLKAVHVTSALTTPPPPSSSPSLSPPPSPPPPPSLNLAFPNEPIKGLSTPATTTFCQNHMLPGNPMFQEELQGPVSHDDPQKALPDSNDDHQPASPTRSILKAPRIYRDRGRLYTDNFVHSIACDVRPATETPQHSTVARSSLLTVARATKQSTVLTGSSMGFLSKDKGRLVRFSADDKIHEFTSLEPVASCQY